MEKDEPFVEAWLARNDARDEEGEEEGEGEEEAKEEEEAEIEEEEVPGQGWCQQWKRI